MRTMAGLVFVFGALQGCGASQDRGSAPESLGVCRDMLTKETLDRLVPPEEQIAMASGKVEDLQDTWLRISCGLSSRVDSGFGMYATVEAIPAEEARKSIARNKRTALSEGNQCRALTGSDGVGEGVICFGDTGATGGDPGVEVSTWIGTRYYNLRLLRTPEKSWDLTRGEAMALVKEIDDNLARELDW